MKNKFNNFTIFFKYFIIYEKLEVMFLIIDVIGIFVATYPIIMSILWISGSFFSKILDYYTVKKLKEYPAISILLPCYNEEKTIEDTVDGLMQIDYPKYTLYMINDKSTDNTLEKMNYLIKKYPDKNLKIVDMPKNGGKARGLNYALQFVEDDYVMVVDSDSYIEKGAVKSLLDKLMVSDDIAAVTGAPIIRNRTTLLGRLQTLEYAGIISHIKRAQAFYFHKIMTISGVLVVYRKSALEKIGGFNPNAMTEDINATWSFYRKGMRVEYQPNAHCYILAPESVKGLVKQRSRWAIGGLETLCENIKGLFNGSFGQRCLLIEMICGYVWAISLIISLCNYGLSTIFSGELNINIFLFFIYIIIGIIQFYLGSYDDQEFGFFSISDLALIPFYLFFYWLLNLVTSVQALYTVFFSNTTNGKWESSDRGL